MRETIQAGTILIKEGTLLPDSPAFESEPYSPGWRSVTDLDGYAMDRKTHDAGWTFFFMAGESRISAIGGEGQKTIRRAMKQILAGTKSGKFNSLEITRVVFKHFLGVPYATVSFHIRNLQEGMSLFGGGNSHAWKNATLVAA
jgi:hypothetical protein